MAIEAAHRKAVAQETIVSVAINALVPSAIIWWLDVAPPETLLGVHPIVKDMLPAAGLATFAMTIILTNIVRFRVRKGALPWLDWPRSQRGVLRHLPQNLLLRAIVLGVVAIALLVPAGLATIALFGILPLTKAGFLGFNLVFGALVGLVMARFVVLPALADPLLPRAAKV